LARNYEVLPLGCPLCGAEMRVIIAFITDPVAVRAILAHLCEPAPPRIMPVRGPTLRGSARCRDGLPPKP
jgi:hypothetical protein